MPPEVVQKSNGVHGCVGEASLDTVIIVPFASLELNKDRDAPCLRTRDPSPKQPFSGKRLSTGDWAPPPWMPADDINPGMWIVWKHLEPSRTSKGPGGLGELPHE